MEKMPEQGGAPEAELESVHLLEAIDSRDPWLAGELDEGARELLLALSFEEALGYVLTVVDFNDRDIDECLKTLSIFESAA